VDCYWRDAVVGLGVGLLNGAIVAFLRINPLIATLAMSFVIGGVAMKFRVAT